MEDVLPAVCYGYHVAHDVSVDGNQPTKILSHYATHVLELDVLFYILIKMSFLAFGRTDAESELFRPRKDYRKKFTRHHADGSVTAGIWRVHKFI